MITPNEQTISGETDLEKLLSSLSPVLLDDEYVFCSFKNARYGDHKELEPLATFVEIEGLTLLVLKQLADDNRVHYETVFKCITLTVHSSLNAIGLTAAVSTKLAENNISANVIAAYYHDHVFIQAEHAHYALSLLKELVR